MMADLGLSSCEMGSSPETEGAFEMDSDVTER